MTVWLPAGVPGASENWDVTAPSAPVVARPTLTGSENIHTTTGVVLANPSTPMPTCPSGLARSRPDESSSVGAPSASRIPRRAERSPACTTYSVAVRVISARTSESSTRTATPFDPISGARSGTAEAFSCAAVATAVFVRALSGAVVVVVVVDCLVFVAGVEVAVEPPPPVAPPAGAEGVVPPVVPPDVPDGAGAVVDTGFVFHEMEKLSLAVFWLPAASVNLLAPTLMVAVPEPDAGGVQVAVYVVPDPAKLLIVPPETVTSAVAKFTEDSERVNVSVMSWPAPIVPVPERVIVTYGSSASTVTEFVDDAERLPDASTAYAL